MKLYFNANLQLEKIDYENAYKGSTLYNQLFVFIPRTTHTSAVASGKTISPSFSGRTPSNRPIAEIPMVNGQNDADNDDLYYWVHTLPKSYLADDGEVLISINFYLKDADDNVAKKTTTPVSFMVYDAVVSYGDITFVDTDDADGLIYSMKEAIEGLASDLNDKLTYADLFNSTLNPKFKKVYASQLVHSGKVGFLDEDDEQGDRFGGFEFYANAGDQESYIKAEAIEFKWNGKTIATEYWVGQNCYTKSQIDTQANAYAKLGSYNVFSAGNRFEGTSTFNNGNGVYFNIPITSYSSNTWNGTNKFTQKPTYGNTPLASMDDVNTKVSSTAFESYKTTHNAEIEVVKAGIIARLDAIESAIASDNVDFDTLQEISTWIENNMSDDSTTLIAKITDLITRVGTLETSDSARDTAVENMGTAIDGKIAEANTKIQSMTALQTFYNNIKDTLDGVDGTLCVVSVDGDTINFTQVNID